jgi:SagB-type dehydrogenase family enzyme
MVAPRLQPLVPVDTPETVYQYHDRTKHHFHAFARSLGYLDWDSQPNPFRAYPGAPAFTLYPNSSALGAHYTARALMFEELAASRPSPLPVSSSAVGDLLRHALGLSAWKRHGASRWPLRVNPSSGNLHPTEAYVICGGLAGLAQTPAVYHYAADRHVLEQRCAFDADDWMEATGGADVLFVALTSIHWRESWKYGERAFRYCQHDLGHAIAALGVASALCGWTATLLTELSHAVVASLSGIDRDEDFVEAEREEPGCVLALTPTGVTPTLVEAGRALPHAVRRGRWMGKASQLSEDHVQWTSIDEVAVATQSPGIALQAAARTERDEVPDGASRPGVDLRRVILQRRSALAFDGQSRLPLAAFRAGLRSTLPGSGFWGAAIPWRPCVHLLIFVHRVDDLPPGLYVMLRDPDVHERFREACGRAFLWEPSDESLALFCLGRGDCRTLARRLSCDQDIAADGAYSLGMIADFDRSLRVMGSAFYRHLFWETGAIGQMLYLSAEAAGVRATGIGCFYDDPVHDVLGLQGHAFQSLYHFTVGTPVEDNRLTTEPGYGWE